MPGQLRIDAAFMGRCVRRLRSTADVELGVYFADGGRMTLQTDESPTTLPASLSAEPSWAAVFARPPKPGENVSFSGRDSVLRALMPINAAGELLGYLAVTANRKNGDLRTETALTIMLPTLAEAVSLQHTHESDLDSMSREIAQRYEELTMVDQIAEALAVKNSRDNGIARLFGALLDSMRCDAVALTVPSQNVCASHPPELLSAESAPVLVESFRTCIEPSLPVAVMNHVFAVPARAMPERVAHAAAFFLDVDGDEGALMLFRKSNSDRFMAGDILLLESAGKHCEIFLSNHKISDARTELFDASIFGLSRLAESRDNETGEHLLRVMKYVELLGRSLINRGAYQGVVDEAFVYEVARSSPLHDIGKVGIRDAVLLKPGKLTAEEFDEMKTHTSIGYDTILDVERRLSRPSDTFLSFGRDIAHCHHEKWNGKGYPRGLKEKNIPLSARIVALADVYDAITSRRCYKDAIPHEKARDIILSERGQHFDPVLVDTFADVHGQFAEIRQLYDDTT